MIAICPPQIAMQFSQRVIPLKILIQIARANNQKPSQKSPRKLSGCKTRKEYDHLYYLANKERKNALQKAYDDTHREQIREYHRRRYLQKKAVA